MEGYARHSRSHFRTAPPPPSSAGAAFYTKSCTNDAAAAAAGRSGFMAYDDVFGGPAKFGATPFAPRAVDYSEIFESFRSGRASSIPMLDLPPVDDSVSAFEAVGCSRFEYSEIFGGFEFADFAVSYDELFRRSDVNDDSSDDAWTPVGTESLSGESDPYASPGRNQYFLNGEFREELEENMFDVSCLNDNLGNGEDSELIHEAQLSSVPGYTCVVEGPSMRKEEESRYSSGVADDIILCEDDSGNISVETLVKTASIQSHGCVAKQSHDYDKKAGGAHEISPSPSSISVSGVSLKTDPSQLPPPSRPPTVVDRKKFPASSTSDRDELKSNTTDTDTVSEGGSLDFFDVELNAGFSSITSTAAMKEAVDRTKVRFSNAKDLTERKKDGVKDMPFMNNDLNRDKKVRMVFDESILRDDELQSTHVGGSNVVQVYWEEMQDATEASQVLRDPLQPEDPVNGAAESNFVQVYWEENQEMQVATEASHVLPDPLQPEDAVNGAAESNVVQVYWEEMQDVAEPPQVLQDPLQPEDAVNGAAESNVVQVYWEEMRDGTEALQVLQDPLQPEDAVNGAAESNVVQVYWEENQVMQDATEASHALPDPLQPEDAVNGAAESNVAQVYWEEMQDAAEASQVLQDPLQPEDTINGAAESNVVHVYWEENQVMRDATEALQVLQDPLQPEDAVNEAAEPAQITIVKNLNSSLDPGLNEGDCEWKVTAECYELVNNRNSETEPSGPSLLDNIKKPVQERNNCHFGNANGSTVSVKQVKQDMETIDASITINEDSKSVDEAAILKDNRRRLRVTKATSRNEFHENMVKVAQNVHGTVISDHVKTMNRKKEGPERDGADWNPEMWLVGEKSEKRLGPAAQHLHYEKKHKEESYLAGSGIRSEDDIVLEKYDDKRNETLDRVKQVAERENNGRGFNDTHQTKEKEEACPRKEAEAMKRALSPGDENLSVINVALVQKEDEGKAGRNEKQGDDVRLKKTDGESRERKNEMLWKKETQKAGQSKKIVEEETMADYNGNKLNVFFDPGNYDRHDVATEMEQLVHAMEMMYDCSAMNKEQKMESKGDLHSEFKITEQDSDQEANLHMDTVPETACEFEEVKSSNLSTNLDEEDIKSTAMVCEYEEKLKNHAAEQMPMDKEKAELGSSTLFDEMEPKAADIADICMSTKYLQKTEADQSMMSEREGNVQKQSLSINTNQRVEKEVKAGDGDLDAEARENAEKLERNEESERVHLREIQQEKERERERECEKQMLRGFEEERKRERERELEKEILRKFEEERERERQRELEKEILRKFEEERERERERELEKERLRKNEEEREKELEKLRLRRLEELREREREKELEKDHLRKLEEERQREREKDLEKERLRKIEEEWEREREREKDRMGNEFKFSAARERAERPAMDRATAEARQRAMNEARERLEKACAEAREKSLGKASKEAQLRAERAAVERATAEARERAIEKAMAERVNFETRERIERSASEKFSSSYRNVELRHTSSSNDMWNSSKSNGVEGESNQRCKARLDRNRRTVERVAKALAEKNMRDLLAQREQAERNRLAETLDADIKRWSSGKEGNLRALLSTLQYILGSDSGWQPIPLTEVINSAAVKKAYRKATLCVHPDKLQQRGANIQQKYICEKVFDLLKDAWNRFNSEER